MTNFNFILENIRSWEYNIYNEEKCTMCSNNTTDFLSAAETAKRWGISKRRVQIFCSQGRVNGAMKVGLVWIIPAIAEKPQDPRKKIQNF